MSIWRRYHFSSQFLFFGGTTTINQPGFINPDMRRALNLCRLEANLISYNAMLGGCRSVQDVWSFIEEADSWWRGEQWRGESWGLWQPILRKNSMICCGISEGCVFKTRGVDDINVFRYMIYIYILDIDRYDINIATRSR